MTVSPTVGILAAILTLVVIAGLVVALAVAHLDAGVLRRDLAERTAQRDQAVADRDQLKGKVLQLDTMLDEAERALADHKMERQAERLNFSKQLADLRAMANLVDAPDTDLDAELRRMVADGGEQR